MLYSSTFHFESSFPYFRLCIDIQNQFQLNFKNILKEPVSFIIKSSSWVS